MTFASPTMLWGLLLLPVVLAVYVLAQRRRARYAVRFTNLDLLASVVQRSPGRRRHLPPALYLLTLGLLLLGLARPQATIAVPREEATIVLVVDVSRSMAATDVAPDRLAAAQAAVDGFVDGLPERFRVGLVAFSAGVETLAAPTTDRAAIHAAVDRLRPQDGTAMGDAIVRAVEVVTADEGTGERRQGAEGKGQEGDEGGVVADATPAAGDAGGPPPAAILLLSDGANTAGRVEPVAAAERAREAGIPVYTIAFGTAEGVLTVDDGPGPAQEIPVPPDEPTLQRVAETTDGRFFAAPSAEELRAVYADLGSRIGFVDEKRELTVLCAAAALVFLVFGGALSVLWFNRFP